MLPLLDHNKFEICSWVDTLVFFDKEMSLCAIEELKYCFQREKCGSCTVELSAKDRVAYLLSALENPVK